MISVHLQSHGVPQGSRFYCIDHMFMISLIHAPKSTLKHIQLCKFMPRSTNSLATVTCNEGSLEMLAYVLFILVWMCKHSYIVGRFVEIHP